MNKGVLSMAEGRQSCVEGWSETHAHQGALKQKQASLEKLRARLGQSEAALAEGRRRERNSAARVTAAVESAKAAAAAAEQRAQQQVLVVQARAEQQRHALKVQVLAANQQLRNVRAQAELETAAAAASERRSEQESKAQRKMMHDERAAAVAQLATAQGTVAQLQRRVAELEAEILQSRSKHALEQEAVTRALRGEIDALKAQCADEQAKTQEERSAMALEALEWERRVVEAAAAARKDGENRLLAAEEAWKQRLKEAVREGRRERARVQALQRELADVNDVIARLECECAARAGAGAGEAGGVAADRAGAGCHGSLLQCHNGARPGGGGSVLDRADESFLTDEVGGEPSAGPKASASQTTRETFTQESQALSSRIAHLRETLSVIQVLHRLFVPLPGATLSSDRDCAASYDTSHQRHEIDRGLARVPANLPASLTRDGVHRRSGCRMRLVCAPCSSSSATLR